MLRPVYRARVLGAIRTFHFMSVLFPAFLLTVQTFTLWYDSAFSVGRSYQPSCRMFPPHQLVTSSIFLRRRKQIVTAGGTVTPDVITTSGGSSLTKLQPTSAFFFTVSYFVHYELPSFTPGTQCLGNKTS